MIAPTPWPAHRTEVRPWRQATPRGPRADREVTAIEVRLPPLIATLDLGVHRSLATMMDNALGSLAALDVTHGRRLKALNQLLLRTESVASSKIENVEASLADYGRALYGVRANASAASMAAATEALVGIVTDADETGALRREALQRAHHALFRRHPDLRPAAGSVRQVQNWIGGSDYSPRHALFVPPPPETVETYLDDLFVYANRDDVPVLVQAAVVHAQFESIHPFTDGNGRIGRTLVHAVLRRRGATRHLTVPIASGLVAHRERYFDALDDYRHGDPATLVGMLASATLVASHESRRTATTVHEIRTAWHARVGDVRPGSALQRVLDSLPAEPILGTDRAAAALGLDPDETRDAVARLRRAGILVSMDPMRHRVLGAVDILDELKDLGSRIEAGSRRRRD